MANGEHAKRATQSLANEARTEAIRRLIEAHQGDYDTIHDEERLKRGLDNVASMRARQQGRSKPAQVARKIIDLSPEDRAALWAMLSGSEGSQS